jgi:acetolactate synthase-1/2/3 large subunit
VTGKVAKFAPKAKIVHIDTDRSELGKLVRTDVAIHADARHALRALVTALEQRCSINSGTTGADTSTWLLELDALRTAHARPTDRRLDDASFALPPRAVYDALDAILARDGGRGSRNRIVSDVGQHQMWAAQLLTWRQPRTHLTSGGAGTMGFAVPAALGVALACPDETVWVVCGDGGFQMTNQEMATIAQEGIRSVKIVVINNGYLGMVRQWQQLFEGGRYSGTPLSGPDFARLAEAYGWWARTVDHRDEVAAVLEAALAHDGPALVDCRVEREANVFPIVPAGKSLDDMMLSEVT